MLQVPSGPLIQTMDDGHPMQRTGLHLWRQPVSPCKCHHTRLNSQEKSLRALPTTSSERGQQGMSGGLHTPIHMRMKQTYSRNYFLAVRRGRDSCGIYYTTTFKQVRVWTSNGCGGGLGCAEPPTRRWKSGCGALDKCCSDHS